MKDWKAWTIEELAIFLRGVVWGLLLALVCVWFAYFLVP